MDKLSLKEFLDEKSQHYNASWFIEQDPISIPHRFNRKEDIEISAFLTATLAWGQRSMILKKCKLLMEMMDDSPYEFVMSASDKELVKFSTFVYRTFNGVDCQYFIGSLQELYQNNQNLESLFTNGYLTDKTVKSSLTHFRDVFMSYNPFPRSGKHVANVTKGSSAKRLNMFLRWMVRDDNFVDFGIWKDIDKSALMIPLDVHVGRVARQLGLLQRKQDDWKSVEELTGLLQEFRPHDPVFYDFALFGIGVYEK